MTNKRNERYCFLLPVIFLFFFIRHFLMPKTIPRYSPAVTRIRTADIDTIDTERQHDLMCVLRGYFKKPVHVCS